MSDGCEYRGSDYLPRRWARRSPGDTGTHRAAHISPGSCSRVGRRLREKREEEEKEKKKTVKVKGLNLQMWYDTNTLKAQVQITPRFTFLRQSVGCRGSLECKRIFNELGFSF